MPVDRRSGDAQADGNGPVRQAFGQQARDLGLATRQPFCSRTQLVLLRFLRTQSTDVFGTPVRIRVVTAKWSTGRVRSQRTHRRVAGAVSSGASPAAGRAAIPSADTGRPHSMSVFDVHECLR